MDDTLVERLRKGEWARNTGRGFQLDRTPNEAADRIEQLNSKLAEAIEARNFAANRYAERCGQLAVAQTEVAEARSKALEEAAKVAEVAATDVSMRIDDMIRLRSAQRRIDAQSERRNGLYAIARAIRHLIENKAGTLG